MDERSISRSVADLAVPAALQGVTIYIKVYNLSPRGCMFQSGAKIEEGAPIEITFPDDVKARGQVIWRKMGFAGVEFLHWLDPSLIEHLGYPEPPGGLDLWDPQDQLGKELFSALPNFSRLH
jgi:hypothetical protein